MSLNKFQEGVLSRHDCEIKVDFSSQESTPNPKNNPRAMQI